MALNININYKGIQVNNAYLKVFQIQGDKSRISFGLKYSASSESSAFDSKTFEFDYNIDGENPIKQAYEHLKTLPEFSGATDC
jgi:hypothetical protein